MKLGYVFPPMLVGGRPLDFLNLWKAQRGTTGSEIQCLVMAKEMAARGHQVTLYIESPNATQYDGVHLEELQRIGPDSEFLDAVVTSLDVNFPRQLSPKTLRVVCQQINDHRFGHVGFDDFVDLYISPSRPHMRMMTDPSVRPDLASLGGWTSPKKWEVIENGCYPDEYPTRERVKGRCVYISSPDRGLHLVLQEWPEIRKAVKGATLKIFYYALEKYLNEWRGWTPERVKGDPLAHHWIPLMERAQYIDKAIRMLKVMGVTVVGSVSRERMRDELTEAEVLTYPCDVIAWTEGFSCATLEGCASGALPILSEVDALGELYREACPMVPAPARNHMLDWRNLTIRALLDREWADEWRVRARTVAAGYAWPVLAQKMERVLEARIAEKRA